MTAHRILSWTPAAVVFDCDGTLMDTERHWVDARDTVLREYGHVPAPGFSEQARGLHYTACGRLMAESVGRPELAEELTAALLDRFRQRVAAHPTTMPGAPELVCSAAQFAPLAVASNCPLEVVESCLDVAGLRRYFDHVVVPDATTRPKPYPDVYLTAARLCGVEPARALAVEDSHCGIQAAAAAGLRVIGVGPRPAGPADALADWWVRSLEEPAVQGWAGARIPAQGSGPGSAGNGTP
ncbi:HAD family hydrolase [Streptomyces yunnanensis]|uniref:Haloacid dehalogenase superfamily, subfamily IA, variant 3 with third motif having DD or ED n=1 Tax=Streptomyces yunnanensis TaxID=156453 RepID=A0A9X8N725_9ACTN|nr:HAD family phosphatase [Streptomyces yunnanensis]SHN19998.1 haloacid dehalogenase superfamily, subfamily IA, variant 3 with third motif having DD or ED [Streptomyces yunnanensis]